MYRLRLLPEGCALGPAAGEDHRTVVLDGWHRVVMNTEAESPFAPRVAFLD